MSNAQHKPSYGSATLAALKNRIDDYADVLYEDQFLCEDMAADRQEAQATIGFLKHHDAIESAEKFVSKPDNKTINRWTWTQFQEDLQDYYESRNELPCGCRTHIPPERDGDTYYCKFCGQGHGRDVIKEAL